MRDVEFFEVGEGVEAGDGGEPVGLDGEDFEVREGGDVLDVCLVGGSFLFGFCAPCGEADLELGDLVLAEPELLEIGERF